MFLAAIATALSATDGIVRVEVRPSTGSLVIWHRAPLARIGAAAEAKNLFIIVPAQPVRSQPPAPALSRKSMVTAAMGFLAIWQLARGRVLPPALTLAMYAIDLAGLLIEEEAASAEAQPDE